MTSNLLTSELVDPISKASTLARSSCSMLANLRDAVRGAPRLVIPGTDELTPAEQEEEEQDNLRRRLLKKKKKKKTCQIFFVPSGGGVPTDIASVHLE